MKQLGVFAKYWSPGATKTRLGAEIGFDRSADIARAFVECIVRRFSMAADRFVLAVAPRDSQNAFEKAFAQFKECIVELQSEGSLGARMRHYFESALEVGAGRVVLIGSDSPTLPREYLDSAFELLTERPVVLGPSVDGGYYLIGIAGTVPPVFEGIAWSTSNVYEQTEQRLRGAGIRFGRLPEWYDVDEAKDLNRLRNELRALEESNELDPTLRRLKLDIEGCMGEDSDVDTRAEKE